MTFMKRIACLIAILFSFQFTFSQIEVDAVKIKDFSAIGFGAVLNFSFPVTEGNYITLEGGVNYFTKDEEDAGFIPVLAGYRYTLDQSGIGFYVEPNAGYNFGESTIAVYNEYGSPVSDGNGGWLYQDIKGPMAGFAFGYLFEPTGKIQFNVAIRYEHGFAKAQSNMFGLRVTHAFSFKKKED